MNCGHWYHLTPSPCSHEGLSMTVASLQLPWKGLARPHSHAHDLAVVIAGGLTNLYPLSCSPQASLVTKSAAPSRPASAMKDHTTRSDCWTSSNIPFCTFLSFCTRISGLHGGWWWIREHCPSSLLSSASHKDASCCSPCCHLVTSDHSTMSHGHDHHQAAGPTLGAKMYWLYW